MFASRGWNLSDIWPLLQSPDVRVFGVASYFPPPLQCIPVVIITKVRSKYSIEQAQRLDFLQHEEATGLLTSLAILCIAGYEPS